MTSIEWLIAKIEKHDKEFSSFYGAEITEAKQIDKRNIKDAYLTGLICPIVMDATKQAEEYYLETFKD